MRKPSSQIHQVLALLTLAVFALCVLLVLLTGADRYRSLVERSGDAYTLRTALQYLTTRVHQAETVEIGTLEGREALILGETLDGECYETYLYCHEGWLRELYAVPGAELPLTAGEPILEAASLALQLEDALLTVWLEEDALLLHLPQGTEVGP